MAEHRVPDDLLTHAAGGDHDAFEQLYRLHGALVRGVAFTVLGDHAQAEEVAHDVFLEIWNTSTRYNPALGSTRTWLTTIARRRAIDRVRAVTAARTRDGIAAGLHAALTEPDPAEQVELDLDTRKLWRAMRHLRHEQRELLVSVYLRETPHQELADRLDVPVGTVKSRVRLALDALRHAMTRPPRP
ncbi:sigma-70 family RNA polymerase sigma factor [Actinosynnema sp. CA-248983]